MGYSIVEIKAKEEPMRFKERYLAGEIPFEEIDIYIEAWGNLSLIHI